MATKKMRNYGRRGLAFFMSLVMMFSMMQLTVFAEGGSEATSEQQIEKLDGSYAYYPYGRSGFGAAGTASVVTNRANDPEVTISKTIAPTAVENEFDITLSVETDQNVATIDVEPDAAVALVFDNSSSMEEKIYGSRSKTKMAATIEAATTFVNNFAATSDGVGKRWVSITTFDGSAEVELGWYDVSTSAGKETVIDAIANIKTGRGTNVSHGLALGSGQLDDPIVSGLSNKFLVLLGDGEPFNDYEGPAGNYNKYNRNSGTNKANAEKWARKIREGQNAKLFSIYVDNEAEGSGLAWFRTFCDETVRAGSESALISSFQRYTALIKMATDAWEVTDPMGDRIEYIGKIDGQNNINYSNGTLIWNLRNDIPRVYKDGVEQDISTLEAVKSLPADNYNFKYSFTYRIRLDNVTDGFDVNEYYKTNDRTTLEYYLKNSNGDYVGLDGQQLESLLSLDFNVPAVQGYLADLEFTKVDQNDVPLAGAEFTLSGRNGFSQKAISGTDGKVSFVGIPSGYSYTLKETNPPANFQKNDAAYAVTVSYGELSVAGVEDLAGFQVVNTPTSNKSGYLTVTKVSNGADTPADATFQLQKQNEDMSWSNVGDAVAYSSFVNGEYKFVIAEPGTYKVVEDEESAQVAYYTLSVTNEDTAELKRVADGSLGDTRITDGEIEIINNYTRTVGDLKITKTALADFGNVITPAAASFTVTDASGAVVDTFTYEELDACENDTYVIENLIPGVYTVAEDTDSADAVNSYTLNVTASVTSGEAEIVAGQAGEIDLVNRYNKNVGDLTINKTTSGNTTPAEAVFTITGPNDYSEIVNYSQFKNGSYTIEDLPLGVYNVTESGAEIANYDLAVSGEGSVTVTGDDLASITLTNTYTQQTGNLVITKAVSANRDEDALKAKLDETLTFTVTDADGKIVAVVKYSELASKGTIELPVGSYTVTETGYAADGYTLDTSESTGFTADVIVVDDGNVNAAFTNVYTKNLPDVANLQITKTTSGHTATPADTKFTVSGPAGFTPVEFYYSELTAENNYTKTFVDVPKGDYTITESGADVADYTRKTTINGDVADSIVVNVTATQYEGSTTVVAINNDYQANFGSLTITKSTLGDVTTPDGALFTITKEGESEPYASFSYESMKQVDPDTQAVTYSKSFEKIPLGTYIIEESGASVDKYNLEVIIPNEGKAVISSNANTAVAITNDYTKQIGGIKVLKVNGENSDLNTPDSTIFVVTNENGAQVASFTYEQVLKNESAIENLTPGNYTVTEKNADVDGYSLMTTNSIDANGTVAKVTVTDKAIVTVIFTNVYTKLFTQLNIEKEIIAINGVSVADDGSLSAKVGDTITYQISVTNSGNTKANGLEIVDTPDKSLTLISATEEGVLRNNIITWSALGLSAGEIWTAEVTAKVNSNATASKAVNTASVDGEKDEATVTLPGLVLNKTITGLDTKSREALEKVLTFTVIQTKDGVEIASETYKYSDLENGTLIISDYDVDSVYTVVENNAEVAGYDLDTGRSNWTFTAANGGNPTANLVNAYTGRIYNIWFDGGSNGKVANGMDSEGVYRTRWLKIEDGEDISYKWGGSGIGVGSKLYRADARIADSAIYNNLVENPEIPAGTEMLLYHFSYADYLNFGREMFIAKPGLSVDNGWTSDKEFYLNGNGEKFESIEASVAYMDANGYVDANGFYNVYYVANYTQLGGGGGGGNSTPDPDPQPEPQPEPEPEIVIPEEPVPLSGDIEIPEEDVPLAELPDEEPPLAMAPETGDNMIYRILALVSGTTLAALALTGKKKEEENA